LTIPNSGSTVYARDWPPETGGSEVLRLSALTASRKHEASKHEATKTTAQKTSIDHPLNWGGATAHRTKEKMLRRMRFCQTRCNA